MAPGSDWTGTCLACGAQIPREGTRGPRPKYCSDACRSAAYRRRHRSVPVDLPRQPRAGRQRTLVAAESSEDAPPIRDFGPSPRELLEQGKITRRDYDASLRVLAAQVGGGEADDTRRIPSSSPSETKAQSMRRDFIRREVERRLRSQELANAGLSAFHVTVLPERIPSPLAPRTKEFRITPRVGETVHDLRRRGLHEFEAWASGLEASDRPAGRRRMAELPRFIDWFFMYSSGLSIHRIQKSMPPPNKFDRKTIARGINVVAGALDLKRVTNPNRFVPLEGDSPTEGKRRGSRRVQQRGDAGASRA